MKARFSSYLTGVTAEILRSKAGREKNSKGTFIKCFLIGNKEFWEELIANFPFTAILVSHTLSRQRNLFVKKSVKQYSLRGCNVGITDEMRYLRWQYIHSWFDKAWPKHSNVYLGGGEFKVIS
jgi:hypothetical protein